jgi:S-adenosylmethionine hydrolase
MKLITLLTDFGLQDGFVGVMKGVIYGICPDADIVDISHLIGPQDVLAGALVLERSLPYFPPGTIHIAVVDPGVGTFRRPIAARIGEYYLVGPDNGIFTSAFNLAGQNGWPIEVVALEKPEYWLKEVSPVFHGRDIFAPVGAHLANGLPLKALGRVVKDPVQLTIPLPQKLQNGWRCQVLSVDHFGTLQLNIKRQALDGAVVKRVSLAGEIIQGICKTFGDKPSGSLIVLFDSSDHLSVAEVNGSAEKRLQAGPGEEVIVELG